MDGRDALDGRKREEAEGKAIQAESCWSGS